MKYLPLDELLEVSDAITIHVPLLDSTYHMIGEEQLAKMKDGAILVNTSRGGLVDDEALIKAVQSGKLRGAGLDVFEAEWPLPTDHPFLSDPRFVVTPHIGGGTSDVGDNILSMLVSDILAYAGGGQPAHVVNREYLK